MVAVPTTREHEDAWHRMTTVPRDNQFEGDMREVPSDHRDENSFHLMAQENKDVDIYPEVKIVHSDRQDDDSIHQMSQVPGKNFTSNEVHTETKADGTINYIGSIDLSSLINPKIKTSPKEEDIKEDEVNPINSSKEEEKHEEEKKEVIMKYYSSIFDKSSSMIAEKEEPVKKYKWASSIDDQTIEEKLHFKDSLDPVHIDAINTWSKIVSNAMLYNFATKIAIEESNNYIMDIDGNLIPDPGKPDTNHLCTCGCEDETECTCGWKDRQK